MIAANCLPVRAASPDPKAVPGHVRHGAGVALLARVLERPEQADQRISAGLRADRRLGSKDRPWVADALYGIVRRWRLLDTLLQAGGWRREQEAEALWWAWMVTERGLDPQDTPLSPAWTAGCVAPLSVLEPWGRDKAPWEWLATVGSVPDWLAQGLLEDRTPAQAFAELEAQDRRAPVVLRVVAHRTDRDAVLAELADADISATPGRWSPHAVRIAGRVHLAGLPCWREGRIALQDEASQVVAGLVAPGAGDRVVDACAGAGGKSLAIAAPAPGGVQIVALDVRRRALDEARKRARREGLDLQIHAVGSDGPLPAAARDAARVLVDAPCSGSGTLRRHAGLRWRWTAHGAADLPRQQAALLGRFAPLVAPGGQLIYATCSLWRAENHGVVERFLADHPDWEQHPLEPTAGAPSAEAFDDTGSMVLTPAQHDTDGFFAALLRRTRGV